MPQDGSNNYYYPPGTPGVPDQTIESEAYNTFLNDLVNNDLNIPRPIHRGGTGASTANAAMFALGGERAAVIVTNYDSHVWMPGSFYSAIGATNAPVAGHAFVGIAYSSDPPAEPPANLNVIIEARDQTDTIVPGRVHIREKKAGVWGPWKGEDRLTVQVTPPSVVNSPDGALWWDSDNGVLYVNYNDGSTTQWVQAVALPQIDVSTFVAKAGDTMTGRLTLSDDPTSDLHAVPKRYVDGGVGGISSGKVSKSGDTMTGHLVLPIAPAADNAVRRDYVDGITPTSNVLINADFRINQAGYVSAAVLAAGAYGHDQWKAGAAGGDYSFTQLKTSTQITIASGKSLIQPVEDVNVVGGSYVLSWTGTAQARAGVNTLTPAGAYAVSPLLIAGQTAGTAMSVEFNAGTLGAVKLERGSTQTPFVMRPYDQELATCQRYYWQLSGLAAGIPSAFAVGSFYSSTLGLAYIKFAQTMRSAPTFTMEGTVRLLASGVAYSTSGATASPSDVNSVRLDFSPSGAPVGAGFIVDPTSAATRFKFDARL